MHTGSRGNVGRLVRVHTLHAFLSCTFLLYSTWCVEYCSQTHDIDLLLNACLGAWSCLRHALLMHCVVQYRTCWTTQLRKCISCARMNQIIERTKEPFMAQWFFSLGRKCKREKLHSQSSVSNFTFFTKDTVVTSWSVVKEQYESASHIAWRHRRHLHKKKIKGPKNDNQRHKKREVKDITKEHSAKRSTTKQKTEKK